MSLPALAAVAGLAVAAHLGRRGSAANVSQENKNKMVDLVKDGRVSEARALALELGLDHLDLSDADLAGANLAGTDLTGANLSDADLTRTDLRDADLTNANLTSANLTNARLYRANLTNANLTGANLEGALITNATGINIGPSRTFIGIPYSHTEIKSNLFPGRTNLRRTR